MAMATVSFHTLGCRLNHTESSSMARSLIVAGHKILPATENADVHVVNSCSVTNQAVKKCKQLMRAIKRRNPLAKIFLVGCFPQSHLKEARLVFEADYILGNAEKLNLAEYLTKSVAAEKKDRIVAVKPIPRKPFINQSPPLGIVQTRASLKIQDGCDFFCSFCIIPFARGRSRSRKIDDLLAEAEILVRSGHKELVLTGVNIGLYQYRDVDFLKLVSLLAEIKDLVRIRISSIEPTTIDVSLLEKMADRTCKLAPYLHLPLQSGSDKTLLAMKRRYNSRFFLDFIKQAVAIVPDICIGTDVIVGFPGESASDFNESYEFLASAAIHYFHVFPYSKREGTIAAKMPLGLNGAELKTRATRLRNLSALKWNEYCLQYINTKKTAIVEDEFALNFWRGYTDNYIKVLIPGKALGGRCCEVQLTGINQQFRALNAELIENG